MVMIPARRRNTPSSSGMTLRPPLAIAYPLRPSVGLRSRVLKGVVARCSLQPQSFRKAVSRSTDGALAAEPRMRGVTRLEPLTSWRPSLWSGQFRSDRSASETACLLRPVCGPTLDAPRFSIALQKRIYTQDAIDRP